MAKTKSKETVVVTRAEKKDATKNLIKEVLAVKPLKHNELLDEVAKLYTERFGSEETEISTTLRAGSAPSSTL